MGRRKNGGPFALKRPLEYPNRVSRNWIYREAVPHESHPSGEAVLSPLVNRGRVALGCLKRIAADDEKQTPTSRLFGKLLVNA